MDLDIKRAFLSPFSEKRWYVKLIFPVIMSTCGLVFNPNLHISKMLILLTALMSIYPNIILAGFYTQFQHNEIHNETPLLPFLDEKVKRYFVYGLNSFGITLIYLLLGLVLFFVIPNLLKGTGIISVLINIIFVLGLIVGVIILFFALNAYADYFCFKDAINFGFILKLVAKTPLEIFNFVLFAIPLTVCINFVSSFTNFMLIISPILIVIMRLILMNLTAQLYKIAKNRLENKEIISQDA